MALGFATKIDKDGSSAGTPEALNGASGVMRAVTNVFEPNVALTGKLKYVQLGLVALAGNVLGYRAGSGGLIGVGVSPTAKYVLTR